MAIKLHHNKILEYVIEKALKKGVWFRDHDHVASEFFEIAGEYGNLDAIKISETTPNGFSYRKIELYLY